MNPSADPLNQAAEWFVQLDEEFHKLKLNLILMPTVSYT